MKVIKYEKQYFDQVAELLALFRVHLKSFKGIVCEPDFEASKNELDSFLHDENYPVYICIEDNSVLGYMILKLDGVIWVEQIFVREDYRRKGVASLLYEKAEEINHDIKEDTLFNYVHPNNDAMIGFLKSKGYTVLNLIEIRKPFKDEQNKTTIEVGEHKFDY